MQVGVDQAAYRIVGQAGGEPGGQCDLLMWNGVLERALAGGECGGKLAGGCDQPASACEVHHTAHLANGGKTSTNDCVLLCRFHHQVVIHRWGWTLVLNPDGTTTAWNKDRTKILHSHGPPAKAG